MGLPMMAQSLVEAVIMRQRIVSMGQSGSDGVMEYWSNGCILLARFAIFVRFSSRASWFKVHFTAFSCQEPSCIVHPASFTLSH
jgi:hypothetical protein